MAKKPASPPPEALALGPATAWRLIAGLVVGVALCVAALLALPANPYYQWQQGDGTILFRARWIYERIHFDKAPIDVAVIGSSRMEASARAPELSAIVSRKLGRPVTIVNFGLPQEGRDLHWAVAKQLLDARPDVKLIVLSGSPEAVISHPGFRFLGDDASVAGAPFVYNPNYVDNLLTIPYRHVAYFVQGLWPRAFQLSPQFDPAIYQARSFDPTLSFRSATGNIVDRDKAMDPATAMDKRRQEDATKTVDRKLEHLPLDQRYAVERAYDRRIAGLAREKHVAVAFLRVPVFAEDEHFADRAFFEGIGPIWEAKQLGTDPLAYGDLAHLNRRGTAILTPWLADQIAAELAGREPPHVR